MRGLHSARPVVTYPAASRGNSCDVPRMTTSEIRETGYTVEKFTQNKNCQSICLLNFSIYTIRCYEQLNSP